MTTTVDPQQANSSSLSAAILAFSRRSPANAEHPATVSAGSNQHSSRAHSSSPAARLKTAPDHHSESKQSGAKPLPKVPAKPAAISARPNAPARPSHTRKTSAYQIKDTSKATTTAIDSAAVAAKRVAAAAASLSSQTTGKPSIQSRKISSESIQSVSSAKSVEGSSNKAARSCLCPKITYELTSPTSTARPPTTSPSPKPKISRTPSRSPSLRPTSRLTVRSTTGSEQPSARQSRQLSPASSSRSSGALAKGAVGDGPTNDHKVPEAAQVDRSLTTPDHSLQGRTKAKNEAPATPPKRSETAPDSNPVVLSPKPQRPARSSALLSKLSKIEATVPDVSVGKTHEAPTGDTKVEHTSTPPTSSRDSESVPRPSTSLNSDSSSTRASSSASKPIASASREETSATHSSTSTTPATRSTSHTPAKRYFSSNKSVGSAPFHSYNRALTMRSKNTPIASESRLTSIGVNPAAASSSTSLPATSRTSIDSSKSSGETRRSVDSVRPLQSIASAPPSTPAQAVAKRYNNPTGTDFKPLQSTLRTTMRNPGKKKPKHTFNAEKPWKHVVVAGTLTEEERKRYDGLFAANKGLMMPAELSNCVHGLVVKQLWKRSRLDAEVLERIWNLVSREKKDYLDQDEFIVGTWLIDQCLYGRKLPQELSPEVWSSLRLGVSIWTTKHQLKHPKSSRHEQKRHHHHKFPRSAKLHV
ncbi:hypothetical protein BZA70DRAFT_280778 [Myxozyma melibiosi]|uniref:EH domain-containing protein n=1 Tax=Myxozyma melibiosi TaxID=54550 RepID=A0ABR1F3M7_9ASCO